jgi:hypothetical protein
MMRTLSSLLVLLSVLAAAPASAGPEGRGGGDSHSSTGRGPTRPGLSSPGRALGLDYPRRSFRWMTTCSRCSFSVSSRRSFLCA